MYYMYFVLKDEMQENIDSLGQNAIHNPHLLNSNILKKSTSNGLQRFYKVDKLLYKVEQK